MRKAFIQLHTAIFLAGFTAILGKLIGLSEGWLVFYRLGITVLLLLLILGWRKELERLSRADMSKAAGVGLVIAFHWVCFYGSIKYANASVALVCLSAAGFFTALIEPVIYRRSVVWPELALGILAIAGIYVIFDFHPQYKTGIVFGILSALGSAVFPVFNHRLVQRIHPRTLTLYELSGGFLGMALLLPVYLQWFPGGYAVPTAPDLGWLLVLSLFCTVFSFELQLSSLKHISPFTANLSYNLEPVYGILMAFAFFHENEHLNGYFAVGVGMILLAVLLQMVRVMRRVKGKRSRD